MLSTKSKNQVLRQMAENIASKRDTILEANKKDVQLYDGSDVSMHDRLIVNDAKVDAMIQAVKDIEAKSDPIGKVIYKYNHPNGMKVVNKTVPFGKILIIYESRPDVTVEAAAVAFKSGNQIMLKGGKEAKNTNLILTNCWHNALDAAGVFRKYIKYLDFNRSQTQNYLSSPASGLDLIIPRGGELLIQFVKENAHCPVLVSGRGNNFLYVSEHADLDLAKEIILNAKISKISACNALDKVLINKKISPDFKVTLISELKAKNVEIIEASTRDIWEEEFLDYKIVIETAQNLAEAVKFINNYSGGHSASIVTKDEKEAKAFMNEVDCAAVYHNTSTRFTDGGQFGMGAELAISTEKMHHRGPLGLNELVSNKWYIYGEGQTR